MGFCSRQYSLLLLVLCGKWATAQLWHGPFPNTTTIKPKTHHRANHRYSLPLDSASACEDLCKEWHKISQNCSAWTYQPTGEKCTGGGIVPKQAKLCYLMDDQDKSLPKACDQHISGYYGSAPPPATYPLPTRRQAEWMVGHDDAVGGFSQFMHFSLPTFWVEGDKFDPRDTYHNCMSNAKYCDRGDSCGAYAPCLRPDLFTPTDLDAEQWVLAAKSLGVQEICLTAQHEGGFVLWPSNYSNYSVQASPRWLNGTGDVLREFADACNKHGVGICYYLHPMCDHYSTIVEKVSKEEFSRRQVGKITEVLTHYGPVSRFWFDGKGHGQSGRYPEGLNVSGHFEKVITAIRTLSPSTLVTGYREFGGDISCSYHSLYLHESDLDPNTTSLASVGKPAEDGTKFFPLEQVGICMQEGPDGNTNGSPTFWFYHPKVGHANASRIFNSWLRLVGHGETGMINIAPGRSGKLDDDYLPIMADVGRAIRDTFGLEHAVAHVNDTRAACAPGSSPTASSVVLRLPATSKGFDYIDTREDVVGFSQRVANYTVEYTTDNHTWLTLVPPVQRNDTLRARVGDRPAGSDPRDQYVGVRRIDVPVISPNETTRVMAVRFRCLRSIAGAPEYFLKRFSLHKRNVPWDK